MFESTLDGLVCSANMIFLVRLLAAHSGIGLLSVWLMVLATLVPMAALTTGANDGLPPGKHQGHCPRPRPPPSASLWQICDSCISEAEPKCKAKDDMDEPVDTVKCIASHCVRIDCNHYTQVRKLTIMGL